MITSLRAGVLLLICLPAIAQAQVLKDLHPSHPRLFLHGEDWGRLRQMIAADPQLKTWHDQLDQQARRMLTEKPIEHVLIGPRLLDKSRTALRRISTLAALYKIDGNKAYFDRARLEMLTAAGFADWNPSHFLDVAEMTNAMAIGYDWLFDDLSEQDRATIRTAIVNLGLKPGMEAFDRKISWTRATHNWSQVCNGGLTIGALAVAQEEPELAEALVKRCRAAIEPAMHAYAPDGGFGEGPGYWGYATAYTVYYLAALESALGTDMGLLASPGFAQTGFYRIQSVGPLGRTFNYADAGDKAGTAPEMLWLSRTFGQPAFRDFELKSATKSGSVFHLIYSLPSPRKPVAGGGEHPASFAELPLDARFTAVNVAYFRSAWGDPNALFVGIKGGDNRTNHSHLDLGSFVLDWAGKRWGVDLGGDDYNLPGYFGRQRWTYYRLRTESHNTLTLDGENQPANAKAGIVGFVSGKERSHAVIDLSDAYRGKATRVMRGLAMLERQRVLVQDEVEAREPVAIRWSFLTPAQVRIEGALATLTQDGETLHLKLLSGDGAMWKVESANPPPPQQQQPGIRNLTVQFPDNRQSATIRVLIWGAGEAKEPAAEPLGEWK